MNKLGLPVLASTLLVLAPQAWAQVYKCVDSSGSTVYSQSPCPVSYTHLTLPTIYSV